MMGKGEGACVIVLGKRRRSRCWAGGGGQEQREE